MFVRYPRPHLPRTRGTTGDRPAVTRAHDARRASARLRGRRRPPCDDEPDHERALQLAQAQPRLSAYAGGGRPPAQRPATECADEAMEEMTLRGLWALPCVQSAWGEIGLDYHCDAVPARINRREVFQRQLETGAGAGSCRCNPAHPRGARRRAWSCCAAAAQSGTAAARRGALLFRQLGERAGIHGVGLPHFVYGIGDVQECGEAGGGLRQNPAGCG